MLRKGSRKWKWFVKNPCGRRLCGEKEGWSVQRYENKVDSEERWGLLSCDPAIGLYCKRNKKSHKDFKEEDALTLRHRSFFSAGDFVNYIKHSAQHLIELINTCKKKGGRKGWMEGKKEERNIELQDLEISKSNRGLPWWLRQ